MTQVAIAIIAGALIGLSLGALGGGGSILAVPVLVYGLGQSPGQATTGSLVVVGATSVVGAVTAHRLGNVRLAQGVAFGVVALAGAALGATASSWVPEPVLLAAFAVLMLIVAALMVSRELRSRPPRRAAAHASDRVVSPGVDEETLARPPRHQHVLKLVLAATAAGLLTGFFGVGGGFLIVPAMVLVLALPMSYAAGTSLVVMTLTSVVALGVRVGTGIQPNWSLVLLLTVTSVIGGFVGARAGHRTDPRRLSMIFSGLVVAVALYTATRALPALL